MISKVKQKKNNLNALEKEIESINNIQKDCLNYMMEIIETDIHYFWPEHKIEEEFVNLFIKSGFDMIENP